MVRMADREISRYTNAIHTRILDAVFRENQHLDGQSPWYEGRSLSVGDVIILDDTAYAVERVGFKKLSDFEALA